MTQLLQDAKSPLVQKYRIQQARADKLHGLASVKGVRHPAVARSRKQMSFSTSLFELIYNFDST